MDATPVQGERHMPRRAWRAVAILGFVRVRPCGGRTGARGLGGGVQAISAGGESATPPAVQPLNGERDTGQSNDQNHLVDPLCSASAIETNTSRPAPLLVAASSPRKRTTIVRQCPQGAHNANEAARSTLPDRRRARRCSRRCLWGYCSRGPWTMSQVSRGAHVVFDPLCLCCCDAHGESPCLRGNVPPAGTTRYFDDPERPQVATDAHAALKCDRSGPEPIILVCNPAPGSAPCRPLGRHCQRPCSLVSESCC